MYSCSVKSFKFFALKKKQKMAPTTTKREKIDDIIDKKKVKLKI
jgi:hypothetical protein